MHVKSLRFCSSGRNAPDAWKKKLAAGTGTKYKPKQHEEEAWQDTSGIYDTDGNLLSLEDFVDDDVAGATGNDDDDDEWTDNFDDNEGLVEDKEIFNLETGWSIEDFVADAPEESSANHKVGSVMCPHFVSHLTVSEVHIELSSPVVLYCMPQYNML